MQKHEVKKSSVEEFGALVRSHDCGWLHALYFHLLGIFCIAIGVFLMRAFMPFKSLTDALFPLAFIVGGLLIIFAGWRNSQTRLNLYESGMTFTGAGGRWECRYQDIAQVSTIKQSGQGATLPVGIQIDLKDGRSHSAVPITKIPDAVACIQSRM